MMITFKETDDVKVVTPDANEITLFNTSGSFAFKDENGDVYTLTKQEDLDAIAATEPKVYVALLTQSGVDAPVATVIKNTLGGEVVWTRNNVGSYTGTLTGAFPLNKTLVLNKSGFTSIGDQFTFDISVSGSNNGIAVSSYSDATGSTSSDEIFNNFTIKIEVYP